MPNLDLTKIARVIDISGVRTDVALEEVDRIVEASKKHHFIAAFAMPCFTRYLVEQLSDTEDVMVGGVVGFPSGADTTFVKVADAKEMIAYGVDELDMVINVGALKSGEYDLVRDDIKAVVEAANGRPVKSILEICYLTDDEIARGAEIAVEAGVTYVKTGTGWGPRPTTVDTIRLIKSTIGNAALIKAAGGIRTLDTLLEMMDAGCSRFGIGINSALKIVEEAYERASVLVAR
ncbi:deoxyribose-phosphate aldolase [Clostridiaceae bacterium NSJ-31]|uniref:Deoxyribose-phosphate aldolase n=1 Tax=Ligaoa zhengdingensis TaxID=2763658 RepID=A0A926DWX4_9FIRM|nr:deoxyribose-phosphate aldolase [Ligaoa zhengdingensis]MBC8546908.1 deoxyribose-phosphate aldolase [Ligaoa zhengdingensis]